MSAPPISPGEMQLLLSRTGLVLNPGQVADLVLAWRQVAALIATIPHDRPLADDMAFAFKLPAPSVTPPLPTPASARKTAAPKAKARPKAKAGPKAAQRKGAAAKAAARPAKKPTRKPARRGR